MVRFLNLFQYKVIKVNAPTKAATIPWNSIEIIPGSIKTSSWDGIEAPKEDFVQPKDIVSAVDMVINSSKGANFEQIIVRPTNRNF